MNRCEIKFTFTDEPRLETITREARRFGGVSGATVDAVESIGTAKGVSECQVPFGECFLRELPGNPSKKSLFINARGLTEPELEVRALDAAVLQADEMKGACRIAQGIHREVLYPSEQVNA